MPLLSVIIPTHNRAKYAVSTINSVLSISGFIQVVVTDSSPVDEISPHFHNFTDQSRLKLIRTSDSISVVENFNTARQAADGEYLVFIGDDDFVSSEIVSLAEWAKTNAVDSLKLNFPVLYYWPDFRHASRGDVYAGTLHISPFSGKIKSHSAENAFWHSLANFGGGVLEMPRAYAGMLSSSLANEIVNKYGALFGGVSPDIYSSAIISIETKKCMTVDFPIVVPGASGGSTTGQSASGGHYGELRENPHISPFRDLIWDNRIPEFYSVPTVWSFSFLKAVELISRIHPDLNPTPNFSRLILKCFVYHPAEAKRTMLSLRILINDYGVWKILGQIIKATFSEFAWGLSRIKNRVMARYVKNNVDVYRNLNSTFAAREALERHIRKYSKRLDC
jgi:glycosyltransferase involved in cell wall biosynthesis